MFVMIYSFFLLTIYHMVLELKDDELGFILFFSFSFIFSYILLLIMRQRRQYMTLSQVT